MSKRKIDLLYQCNSSNQCSNSSPTVKSAQNCQNWQLLADSSFAHEFGLWEGNSHPSPTDLMSSLDFQYNGIASDIHYSNLTYSNSPKATPS